MLNAASYLVLLRAFRSSPARLGFRRLSRALFAALALVAGGHAAGAAGSRLVFMGDRDLPPYEFLENGKPRGANVDLAVAIGRVLGRPVDIRLQDWEQAQAAFRAGQGAALTMYGRTPEREQHFDFSQPTMPLSFALFVRADETSRFDSLSFKDKRIGVTRAGLAREYFQSKYPDAQLVMVDSLSDATRRLVRRDIDGFAAQEWSQYYLLSELGTHMVVGLPAFSSRFGNIAVRKGDTALLQDIDRALTELKSSGEFDRILGEWSHTRVTQVRQSTVEAAAVGAVIVLVVLALLAGTLVLMRRQKNMLRLTQRQLQAADRRKDEFLATLAHELRNPLAPISNAATILQSSSDPAPQARWAQGVIVRQVSHMARLIDDLLDISRINTGKLELRKDGVELNSAIEDAVEAARPVIDQGRHALQLKLHGEPLWLRADRVRLVQVITNLLNNAAKYMPPGGRIELSTAGEGEKAVLRVKDEGVGIPPHRLAKIFDMFYQEDRSRERAQGGLGIGLWLTQQLVLMHEGSIAATSEGEGRGSEFTVKLPLSPAPPVIAQQAPAASRQAGRRILIVDDNRDGAETMALLLGEMGHRVDVAVSGEQAMRVGEAVMPDIVFLDIGMPDMDGFEVCRRLRETAWGRSATVVALTGWGAESDKQASRGAGFDAHLTKPASLDALAAFAAGGRA